MYKTRVPGRLSPTNSNLVVRLFPATPSCTDTAPPRGALIRSLPLGLVILVPNPTARACLVVHAAAEGNGVGDSTDGAACASVETDAAGTCTVAVVAADRESFQCR